MKREKSGERIEVKQTKPKIKLLTMFRLGLFQMALGIMSLLTLGVLNRVMIDELGIIPIIAAGAIAMHQFVSPARIWFGQMSDSKALLNYHRTGYIWLGAIAFTTISFIALQVVWQLGNSLEGGQLTSTSYGWAGVLALIFGIYGLALSASSTPFVALLVDISDEDNRSKLIGVVWSMLMVGIIVGAIIASRLLNISPQETITASEQLQNNLNRVFIIIPAIVFGLCVIATIGVEKKYSRYQDRLIAIEREDQITLNRALKILTASPQTGVFFGFLLLLTISLFMQDAVLEPYGGEVFNMSIAETTQLNVPFGTGTLIGIASTGFLVLPRLGKKKTVKIGCIGAAVSLMLTITAGMYVNPGLLKTSLLLFGLSSGTLTAGATSLMLDLTVAETAGTFIGAWGLAQAMARGLATVFGGAVLNLGKAIFETEAQAYSMVFSLQAIGMLLAIWVLDTVNVKQFQDNTKEAIARVIEGSLDG